MPSADRGNKRCFEALGSNSLRLSDEGNYPDGMSNGSTMITYDPPEAAAGQIRILLKYREQLTSIARAGHKMMSTRYSKEVQWRRFEALVASI
jgi:Glycosyl transferases group 1